MLIRTEPLGKQGEVGEQKVADAFSQAFSGREYIGFAPFLIFCSRPKQIRWESDLVIADQELGVILIEVKSIRISDIVGVNGQEWQMIDSFYKQIINPYRQVEEQSRRLIGYCDHKPELERKVSVRILVALPFISESEWKQKGWHEHPSCPPALIFSNQLSPARLLDRIQYNATFIQRAQPLGDQEWRLLKQFLCGVVPPPSSTVSPPATSPSHATRSEVVAQLKQWIGETDSQQVEVAWQVPPGPQRIRGIAGSGKTVLLCQKAAHMHWRHPEWDIALVFFTRSLYQQAIDLVASWLQYFSNNELQYDPSTSKLKVLHAWGANNQPGLYSTVRAAHGLSPVVSEPIDPHLSPPCKLAKACRRLLETMGERLHPMFDAILIDEGQDLVTDNELKFQDRQAFYWLAWQVLRPVHLEEPHQRRLIWAYDEAQSLDSLIIPEAQEVLGKELWQVVRGSYIGGIQKSQIMRYCYRTPGPILIAAHAIGMGLLRPAGMLTGITQKNKWREVGYQILAGDFRSHGQEITLHRPPENSPNPIPTLWHGPVLEFNVYSDRDEELAALAKNIRHNLEHDRLNFSRDLLVVILGNDDEAMKLESRVAGFLRSQGIPFYIPGTAAPNTYPRQNEKFPNTFWQDSAVTVSRVYRAKGNEAYMVYVVGFDHVAQDEANISLRNQVFVALTRAKGWAQLSGIGTYLMYEEMNRVIASGNTFTFTYGKTPVRMIDEQDDET